MNAQTATTLDSAEINAEPLECLAQLLKTGGDSLRLQILKVLQKDSFAVSELCDIFEIRQPALSHHLKQLTNAELVITRREGNSIYYRRRIAGSGPDFQPLRYALFNTIDETPLPAHITVGIQRVYNLREQHSREFFTRNAARFTEQQDLIASYDQYAQIAADTLSEAPDAATGSVLEVGPGDGAFLAFLSQRFDKVTALDNAREMLDQARQFAAQGEYTNIQFIHGDTRAPSLNNLTVDCAVINMVLHHTPAPGQIFNDVANHMNQDGLLLVTELCQHDQGWVREHCGDLWLGFEPARLDQWASEAGLNVEASQFLAQRNGFQIQVRLYRRQGQQSRRYP